ncbi:unnamed protein product, partial [Ilex paraguariensis]
AEYGRESAKVEEKTTLGLLGTSDSEARLGRWCAGEAWALVLGCVDEDKDAKGRGIGRGRAGKGARARALVLGAAVGVGRCGCWVPGCLA